VTDRALVPGVWPKGCAQGRRGLLSETMQKRSFCQAARKGRRAPGAVRHPPDSQRHEWTVRVDEGVEQRKADRPEVHEGQREYGCGPLSSVAVHDARLAEVAVVIQRITR
jgi:hypothetical protein